MRDSIDRQAAIDALGERPAVWIDDDEYSLGQRNQYDCDKLAIETVPSAQSESCEDAVSRADVKEIVSFECGGWCGFAKTIIKKIEDMPSVTPKQHWIPCSERLPYAEYGESDTVLATCGYWDIEDESNRWIRMLYYDGGNWCYPTGETYPAKVYAWMPLPEPYQEEGDK